MDIINDYEPKHPETAKDTVVEKDSWDGIVTRVLHLDDDGHAAKLVRALAHAENICAAYSMNDPLFRIKGDMWLQLGHMGKLPQDHSWDWLTIFLAIDSVEGAENTGGAWVRSAGFPQAWEQ